MAAEAPIVDPQVPKGSLISFDFESCEDFCLVVDATGDYTPTETDYCFQLPLFEVNTEQLALTNEVVSFATTFTNNNIPAVNDAQNTTGAACPAFFDGNSQIIDAFALGLQIPDDGRYFSELLMEDITLSFVSNQVTDVDDELIMRIQEGTLTRMDDFTIVNGDEDTTLFQLGATEWLAGDFPSLWAQARSACNGSLLEQIQYDINVTGYSMTPSFFEKTVSGVDNTFYRLKYKLAKTSASSVQVIDENGLVFFEAASDGVGFDKIFQTGVLPGTQTFIVRFQIEDSLFYPDADWNVAVLTEVQLWEMCWWDATIETLAEVNVGTYTQTHATSPESTGNSYHPNINYCYDVTSLAEGCYQTRVIDNCDLSHFFVSNCLKVCAADCDFSVIEWTPDRVICSGSEVLDYVAYPTTSFLWAKVSLQDLTLDTETEFYRKSNGFWEVPWSYQNTVEVLQLWPLVPFARQAIGLAMASTFSVDGVEYQKLNDDDFLPQFNATYNAPMRILVSKVGDFIISRL